MAKAVSQSVDALKRWEGVDIREMLSTAAKSIGAGSPTDAGRSWRRPTEHSDPIVLTAGIPDAPTLPVDDLKIDGAFVKDIVDDEVDLALVRSINDMGKVMGKRIIAEFVENDAILEKLREIGVDYVQGYGISRPAPITEAT